MIDLLVYDFLHSKFRKNYSFYCVTGDFYKLREEISWNLNNETLCDNCYFHV